MPSLPVVYVSASDRGMRSYLREKYGSLLGYVCELDAVDEPVAQKAAAVEALRARIAACDEVLYLAGGRFGAGPDDAEDGKAYRSFAQMEYDLAVELGKPLHVVLLEDGFPWPPEAADPIRPEPYELQSLQRRHLEAIAAGPHPVTRIGSLADLKTFILAMCQRLHSTWPTSEPAAGSGSRADPDKTSCGSFIDDQPPNPSFPAENVVFTVYRPGAIQPGRWEKLLCFAHLDEKPPWLDEDERTPIEEMEAQAAGILGRRLDHYSRNSGDSRFPVPRDGEITLAPEMAGVEFDPPRRSFFWREEVAVHGETFRLRASAAMEGQIARGRITVFLGALILAEIGLAIRVGGSGAAAAAGTRKSSAAPFRRIFASYSHRDLEVVEALERHARTLGDEYLRDWMHLRSGEQWDARLLALVEQADVFQLFWSNNSARSPFVEREWRHALRLGREAFVRPTYWEQPMPPPPPDLAGIHFHLLTAAVPRPAAPEPSIAAHSSTFDAPGVQPSDAPWASAPSPMLAPIPISPPEAEPREPDLLEIPAFLRPPASRAMREGMSPASTAPAPSISLPRSPARRSGLPSWWLILVLILVALLVGCVVLRLLR